MRTELKDQPYGYDNPAYWSGFEPAPQLKAQLLKLPADSSATILIGMQSKLADNFAAAYSDTTHLREVAS